MQPLQVLAVLPATVLTSAFAALAVGVRQVGSCTRAGSNLDAVSIIQVGIEVNSTLDSAVDNSTKRSSEPWKVRRSIIWGLPAPMGHKEKVDRIEEPDRGSRDIVHTRGHFNSLIFILIFASLALVSISAYCFVVILGGQAHQEPTDDAPVEVQRRKCLAEGLPALVVSSKPRNSAAGDTVAAAAAGPEEQRRLSELGVAGSAQFPKNSKKRERRFTWSSARKAWSTERWSPEEGEETMSAPAFVVNIVADLCPSGFLSIAYGMDGTGYVWAGTLLFVFCSLCVYTMWACGRTCEISGERDFASQWALVLGPGGSWVPLLVIIIVAFGALLCYACYFGDLLEEVMPALGLHLPRYACLISFSLFPALPLCLLKNLSALAYSSFFAMLALIYTATVMCVRAADGSYRVGGTFYQDVEESLRPDLPEGKYLLRFGARSLLFINILAMAFHCHCNACKYYRELKGTTPRHFRNCTIVAMGLAALLYAVIGFVGFKTFGFAAHGTILKNYSLNDLPVNLARILISLSLAASYAIMFSALREACIGLLKHVFGRSAHSFDLVWRQDILSGVLVALVTVCGVISKDSGLVDGFVGAFCGNAIIYVIPCLLYTGAVKSFLDTRRNASGIRFSICLVILGFLLSIAGCVCLVIFEVEADPPRPVSHHWSIPRANITKPLATMRHLEQHMSRHLWSMR